MSSLRFQRKAMPDLFIGAFADRGLVGVVLASDDTRKGWLNRIAVVPAERGRGIARALIKASEEALRKRGRRMFCVHIEEYNEESMDLFEKQGYKRESDIFYYAKRDRKDY
jgi:ribosomal protein S18 acetylase RimI-like enzyme